MSKKTVAEIIDSENDYIIAVKKNQPNLYQDIQKTVLENDPCDIDYTLEKNRGRREERAVFVYDHIENIDPDWKGLKSIIQVNRSIDGAEETNYYISSLSKTAIEFNQGIRDHWRIENSLHWTKDVVFKEDNSKIKAQNAPENISLIKSWVMTLFRSNGFKSMTKAVRSVANDFNKMINLLE